MSVTLSLLDNQAVSFHKKLEGMRDDPKVIVATSINPRLLKVFNCYIPYVSIAIL